MRRLTTLQRMTLARTRLHTLRRQARRRIRGRASPLDFIIPRRRRSAVGPRRAAGRHYSQAFWRRSPAAGRRLRMYRYWPNP